MKVWVHLKISIKKMYPNFPIILIYESLGTFNDINKKSYVSFVLNISLKMPDSSIAEYLTDGCILGSIFSTICC